MTEILKPLKVNINIRESYSARARGVKRKTKLNKTKKVASVKVFSLEDFYNDRSIRFVSNVPQPHFNEISVRSSVLQSFVFCFLLPAIGACIAKFLARY